MTFTELQTQIADRLNLTSARALTRIGESINERYRRLATSIGIKTVSRATASATTVIGTQTLTFGPTPVPVEKILMVYDATVTPIRTLYERTVDEIRNLSTGADPARLYAVYTATSNTVTLLLESLPSSNYTLTADVLSNRVTLAGTDVPAFPESFHDLLLVGGMATEYDKMEKLDLSDKKEQQYETRLSELRLHLATSAYLNIVQGKNRGSGTRGVNLV